jgi:hypothetical protein
MKKRIFGSIFAGFMALSAMGQVSNTLSPYSQFGIGMLSDQSLSYGRGMAGLSIGVRDSKHPNVTNPASYSSVDSLTMIFDIGISGQITNFKEGDVKKNAKTADFDYAVASFRLLKKVGASIGIIPYVWNRASAYYERQANKIDNITTLIEKQLEQDRISININPQDYFGKKKKKIKPIDLSTLEE